MKRFTPYVFLLTCFALPASAFTPTSDGMYAVVNVTFFDGDVTDTVTEEFTIQLTYAQSPVTCANFVGLATGLMPWYDFETRQARGGPDNPEPFYDGLVFHRVIPNFVIQTGSRGDTGGGGPGFQIPNEIDPDLNHVGGGIASMANSSDGESRLNSGGSQFFITMAQFPETQFRLDALNGKHSIFGFLIEGHEITQKMNRTPLTGVRPTFDMTINSITIVKEGEGANSWDPSLYWLAPDFVNKPVRMETDFLDLDNNPETPDIGVVRAKFTRSPDASYILDGSNSLHNWSSSNFPRGTLIEEEEVVLSIANDLFPDGRHFYRLLEVKFPPLPGLDGQQITINFDPIEDTEDDLINFLPEVLTIDFYDQLDGGWQMQRSDSTTMKPIGTVLGYQMFPLAHRRQLLVNFDFFTTMQAYLSYETPTSGSVYIYWTVPRPEGATVTGTFTMGNGGPRRVPQNKDGTRIIIITTDSSGEGDPVVSTYTIDLWDNFSEEGLTENFEGGYTLSRSNTEFINTGRVIYEWVEVNGETYLNLNFNFSNDLQMLLNFTSENGGSGEAFSLLFGGFLPSTFTTSPGEPRPNSLDKEGDRLVLTFDVSDSSTNLIQSEIHIQFYDNFEGGYEATRTDTEVNQFGDLLEYQWFENNGQTRVDLTFDNLAPMQAYLTFTSAGSGSASVHFPSSGQVVETTFTYTEGEGIGRPVLIDKNGTKLELDFDDTTLDLLTINLYEDFMGTHRNTRMDDSAQPSGEVTLYDWFERLDGTDLIFFEFSSLPTMQVILNYTTDTTGEAKVLLIDSGTVNTIPFTIGSADPIKQSVNKTGFKLVIDVDEAFLDSLIDKEELEFLTTNTGQFTRFFPDGSDTIIRTGQIEFYEWFEGQSFDQVNLLMDFLLDQQVFLDYETATSGKATIYFPTGSSIAEGTFTIEAP